MESWEAMSPEPPAQAAVNRPAGLSDAATYQICVRGCLDDHWANWFAGMTLTRDVSLNTTLLTGTIPDQAALHGTLAQIRDLGLTLVWLTRLEAT
jgi:hypothetical protein